MKQIKILSYILDSVLSNKYLVANLFFYIFKKLPKLKYLNFAYKRYNLILFYEKPYYKQPMNTRDILSQTSETRLKR